ncbi:MAG TPA: class I SAM-dependent RNA methyltransferase [Stellaceae bacterium]|nr:class I SAM-dependent RNA methyltransferase [Stellaceae bacterium]
MRRTRGARLAPEAFAEVAIDEIGAGDGIGRGGGERVFVPFTVPGDRVRVRLGSRREGGREGEALEWLATGSGRRQPPCPHFGVCGGCSLQHLADDLYRDAKLAGLRRALARTGIAPGVVAPLRAVTAASRRRIRLGLRCPAVGGGQAQVGLRPRFSHALVDLRDCHVLEPGLLALIEPLRRLVPALLPRAGAAEALLTRTDSGIDMVLEVATPPSLPGLEALAAFATAVDLARIVWRTPHGEVPVVERRPPRLLLSGVSVPVPPGAFLQASAAAERLLVAEVAAAVPPDAPALDLYAGLGTFAFALAADGRRVHAVEGDAAVVGAIASAAAAMPRVTVERRDLARDPLRSAELAGWEAVVFDPPRAGALPQAEALAASGVATVVAVSCNPATFARDARRLCDGGFRLERVAPIDQFVWTPHLELIAVFRR